jgi:transposase InsO family protein
VIDHFSRAVAGLAIFRDHPTSCDGQSFLGRTIRQAAHPPGYIVTDKGRQFWCGSFKHWCRLRAVRPRFGAVGKQGSIAVVARFLRSMKVEGTKPIRVPLWLDAMRREIGSYATWYNLFRPDQALGGRSPWEVYSGLRPANVRPRFESRENWPANGPCASPQTAVQGERGKRLSLVVGSVDGRRRLPVV